MSKLISSGLCDIFHLYPSQIEICLSEKCNFDCDYCLMNKSCKENLDIEKAKKGIDFFLSVLDKNKTITFNSGEPLLRFALLREILEYTLKQAKEKKINLQVVVTTNGLLLNKKIDYFSKNSIKLNISLDGQKKCQDTHRKLRGNKQLSSFDVVWSNIKNLSKKGTRIITTITPDNIRLAYDNFMFFIKSGFRKFDFFPQMFVKYRSGELKVLNSQIKKINNFIFRYNNQEKDHIDMFWLNRLWGRSCYNKVLLGSDGNFYLFDAISTLPYTERRKYLVGNINDGIDYEKRLSLFNKIIEEMYSSIKNKCFCCKANNFCFFPVPLYLWCKSNNRNFSEYWENFCKIAKIYVSAYNYLKEMI